MTCASVIEMNGITRVFGAGDFGVRALDGIDLHVGRGEFLALMGPSGSGKSTLMNILGCLDRPTSGRYVLGGRDVSGLSEAELAHTRRHSIGFVFQTFNLLPRLTALHNVELPMIYARVNGKERRQKAIRLLETVGLGHRLEHRPNMMSGGERQRVAVARSLANDPELLLADEPTGNLDSRSGEEIVSLLVRLHEEGRTILLITHEKEVADRAGRVVYIRDGRISGEGNQSLAPAMRGEEVAR
jgi:putative ABC transport system ATP-binding protein